MRGLDTAHLLTTDGLEIARDRLERIERIPRVGRSEPAQIDAPTPAPCDLLEVSPDPMLAAELRVEERRPQVHLLAVEDDVELPRVRVGELGWKVALLGAERLSEASDQLREGRKVHVHLAALRRVVERAVGEDLEVHPEHLLAHLQREPEAVGGLGRGGHRGKALELWERLLRAAAPGRHQTRPRRSQPPRAGA